MLLVFISPPVGRCVAKGRSAVRCTGWRTATCGAPRAAGRRPARDSLTDRPPQLARPTSHAVFQLRKTRGKGGGASSCMHSVFFRSTSQLSVKLWPRPRSPTPSHTPPNLISSTEPFQLWKQPQDGRVIFHIAVRDSQRGLAIPFFPSFWENLGAAKQCKEKKKRFLQFFLFSFFNVGFSVASFYVLYSSGF